MRASATIRRLQRSASRLTRTHYPSFLFGAPVAADEIPVFVYHDVTAAELALDLQFLASNGYRTLSIDEFHRRMMDRAAGRERLVLLTFDDARRNFWEVAYPVLVEHRARATLFAPSHWIAGSSDVREEPKHHNSAAQRAANDARTAGMFMSWDQLACCEQSGLIDVESHGHRHALVYTSERLVGFASPAMLTQYDLFDWPMRHEWGVELCGYPPLGTPIYESAPLLSAERCLLEPLAAVDACRRLVAGEGGEAFFAERGWQQRLRALHDRTLVRGLSELQMSNAEHWELVVSEAVSAIGSFERELGRPPRFFAYPWMLGSLESQQLLRDCRIRAAFGVALDFHTAKRNGSALPVYARYKADWLRFLPGEGRRRLREILPRKLASFVGAQHLAH